MAKAFHLRTGTRYIVRELVLPFLEQSYEDTLPVAQQADVLVSHPIAMATPVIAEQIGKPWMGVILQPAPLLSIYDPPRISGAGWLNALLNRLGPRAWAFLFRTARRIARGWGEPINRLRRGLGLSVRVDPILEGIFSPYATQGWFSSVLAKPQRDWPRNFSVTGFPLYDKSEPGRGLDPALLQFLDSGPPPVVFTLGSSAVFTAGNFYRESLRAALDLGCRAVLLTGPDGRNQPAKRVPDTIHFADYAPYSQLLPRAAATVHQGGVGTTAQALLAAKPMLVVPYSHDQPDNAMRVTRLGVGRTIARGHYRADRIAAELRSLLSDPSYAVRAEQVAEEMRAEDGVGNACDGLEALLR